MENENLRQSATTALLIKASEDEYVVGITNALIGKVTCSIDAVFPNKQAAEMWIESFGITAYNYRNYDR